jgi:hypothetical protein
VSEIRNISIRDIAILVMLSVAAFSFFPIITSVYDIPENINELYVEFDVNPAMVILGLSFLLFLILKIGYKNLKETISILFSALLKIRSKGLKKTTKSLRSKLNSVNLKSTKSILILPATTTSFGISYLIFFPHNLPFSAGIVDKIVGFWVIIGIVAWMFVLQKSGEKE